MQELWFLHSAYPLMLVDICMKFHDASLYGLKVIERTRWKIIIWKAQGVPQ